jgi:hypothetical protein
MKQLGWTTLASQLAQPLGLPDGQLLHRVATDTQLDQMERHVFRLALEFGWPSG